MKNNYVYPAKILQNGEKIILEFVDFSDIVVEVKKEEELIEEAQKTLAIVLLDYIEQGREVPKASVLTDGVIYVQVWIPYYKNMEKVKYIKKTVTIPDWLDDLAKKHNINFSSCLVRGIKEELGIAYYPK